MRMTVGIVERRTGHVNRFLQTSDRVCTSFTETWTSVQCKPFARLDKAHFTAVSADSGAVDVVVVVVVVVAAAAVVVVTWLHASVCPPRPTDRAQTGCTCKEPLSNRVRHDLMLRESYMRLVCFYRPRRAIGRICVSRQYLLNWVTFDPDVLRLSN